MSDNWWMTEKTMGAKPSGTRRLSIKDAKLLPIGQVLRKLHPRYEVHLPDRSDGWSAMRCPFHEDKAASASINISLNRFRCHSCAVGGDAIDVVEQVLRVDTKGALAWLNGKFGVV